MDKLLNNLADQADAVLMAAAIVVVAVVTFTGGGVSDEERQRRLYCEMVTMGYNTADAGWPDYAQRYAADCTQER